MGGKEPFEGGANETQKIQTIIASFSYPFPEPIRNERKERSHSVLKTSQQKSKNWWHTLEELFHEENSYVSPRSMFGLPQSARVGNTSAMVILTPPAMFRVW